MDKATERTAKLADVAKAARVSQGTVSNVFNRPELVREEVRDRVLKVADEIGYRGPDPRGRLLRAGKVNAIGITTSNPLSYFFEDQFARTVMRGIAEVCDRQGAGIALVSASSDETMAWNIRSAVVDGFILFCLEDGPRLIELTRERQLPFVALDMRDDDQTISALSADNASGARMAAAHLAGLGHRRIAIIALPMIRDGYVGPLGPERMASALYTSSRRALEAYLSELAIHGVAPERVRIHETLNDEASTVAALESLFAAPEKPTAIIVQSDRAALYAIGWLRANGYDVPGDVSVVGFDGVPEAEAAGLTTVAQPMIELGREAARIVLQPHGVERRALPVELVVRSSTAPPRR